MRATPLTNEHADVGGEAVDDRGVLIGVAIEVQRHHFSRTPARDCQGSGDEGASKIPVGHNAVEVLQDDEEVVPTVLVHIRDGYGTRFPGNREFQCEAILKIGKTRCLGAR